MEIRPHANSPTQFSVHIYGGELKLMSLVGLTDVDRVEEINTVIYFRWFIFQIEIK